MGIRVGFADFADGVFLQDSRFFLDCEIPWRSRAKGKAFWSAVAWRHGMHGLVQKSLSPQLAFSLTHSILVRGIMIPRSVFYFAASGTGICIARCAHSSV